MTNEFQSLLRTLEANDIQIEARDGRLHVDAPEGALTPALRKTLTDHKPQLMSMLTVDWSAKARAFIASLPDESLRSMLEDYFEETAATLEFDQNRPREEAERNAFGLLISQALRVGVDAKVVA